MKRGNRYRHGMTNTPIWRSWQSMHRRCRGGNEKSKWYADRGIEVCERWSVFENFVADMGPRPDGTTLDRIDNDKGYSPENCRWATVEQQQNNKRSNVILELNGVKRCLEHWAKHLNIHKTTLRKRLLAGWPVENILSAHMFHENKGRRA